MKMTKELINKIKSAKKGDISFWNEQDFKCPQIHYYLADLLKESGVSNAEFIRELHLERSYGYQVLNGTRRPTREILICAAILLGLDFEETQRLLNIGKRQALYPRVKKDAIVIYSLDKGLRLEEYRDLLEAVENDGV